MAVYCTRCGTGLPDGARFCSSCGATIVGAPLARPTVRPRVGRVIAGVCIGLSQANGWDVATVRIIAVIAFFFSGGLVSVAYLACWVGIPEEPYPMPYSAPFPTSGMGPGPGPVPPPPNA
jgi:phage shock protein PspC (stress-responsive transcriptional regulator)